MAALMNGFHFLGVECSYLAAAREGDSLIMDAEVIKAGKTLAFTRADLILKESNRIVATGLHTKAFPPEK
ncbi:hypothetical protein TELCIR_22180 [Teladorsagia circumcincta]|uniref:Thioesterase domain-containing protein n=1 Tax=Teladorsagia circumcincta TaxID=45464 RepID=A0A2G9TEP3_TELCI|nr:hypothetical protein TELCIR_22180 [Teladorsagia circumcincta]